MHYMGTKRTKPVSSTNGNNDQLFQLLTPPTVPPCTPCAPYITTTSAGVIVPGTTDIGNHCDDCASPVTIPFAVTIFGTNYPSGTVFQATSNGSVGIDNANAPFGTCAHCRIAD